MNLLRWSLCRRYETTLGQFTVEETIRNFFGLYKEKIVDQAGNVIDIVDDFRNDVKLKKT